MRTLVLSMTLVLSLALLGCERENPAPPDASRPDAQLGDAGPVDSDTDAGDLDGGGLADGGDGGTPTDAGTCAIDGGTCFACAPVTNDQHLDACTTATCEPFPITTARLPRLNADGTLPPLP